MPASTESEHGYSKLEYQPSLRSRISGLLGRLGVNPNLQPETHESDGPTVNEVLNRLEAGSNESARLEPTSPAAQALLASFQRAPQFDKPAFLSPRMNMEHDDVFHIDATVQQPVALPVRNFVSAPGIENWNGGTGYKSGKNSFNVIRSYARKHTVAPPIGFVVANVQPDGKVFYQAVQDGAHRLSAAHLRGDSTIDVGATIIVRKLYENIIN